LLPAPELLEAESGVGILADALRKPRFAGRGVFSRVCGSSFSLSELVGGDLVSTE
jgi:hypothetical protein